MDARIRFDFKAKIWKTHGKGSWFFISLPKDISSEIRASYYSLEEGWGRMKVIASIDKLEWKTSIWYDKKSDIYLLPLKAEIRKKAFLSIDDIVSLSILI